MTATGAATDTTVLPQKEGRMKSHFVCGVCYPDEVPMGTPALCGVKLLGVIPPPNSLRCTDCQELKHSHALKHMRGY